MKTNGKHITYEERCIIEDCINKGFRKFEIAKEINKSTSTILREIRKNRILKPRKIFNENPFNCIYLKDCRVCTGKCKYYLVQEEINISVLVIIALKLKSVNSINIFIKLKLLINNIVKLLLILVKVLI